MVLFVVFQGLGLKKIPNNSNNVYRPNFLAWAPLKIELKNGPPGFSVYKRDFQGSPAQPLKQQLVQRPKTSFDNQGPPTTTYRYTHGFDNPSKQTLCAMSNEGLKGTSMNAAPRPRRARVMSAVSGRESVASCLSWYVPRAPARPKTSVPISTQTAVVTQSLPVAIGTATGTHQPLQAAATVE